MDINIVIMGWRPGNQGSIPDRDGGFPLTHSVQTSSGAHPTFCSTSQYTAAKNYKKKKRE
jgi:hypothetical protein